MGKPFSKSVKEEVRRRSNGHCWYCGAPGIEADHMTPPNKGGTNLKKNAAWSCRDCNAEKKGEGISRERMWTLDQYKEYVAGQLGVPKENFKFYLGRLIQAEREAAALEPDERIRGLILRGFEPQRVGFPEPFDWPRTGIKRRNPPPEQS